LPPCSRWARKIRFHRAGPAAAIEGCCQFHNLPRPDGSKHTPPSLLLTGVYLLCSLLDCLQAPLLLSTTTIPSAGVYNAGASVLAPA
jgi:hypothetical protein